MKTGSQFWFKVDYLFSHASGEVEILNDKVFTVNKLKSKLIYCTCNRGRSYILPLDIKNKINII